MDDHTLDTEYAEDLRRIVRGWRASQYRKMKRADRIGVPQPTPADQVSDALVRCAWVLVHAYRGAHHVGTVKVGSGGGWMEVTHYSEVATADGDVLTRLVVLAHDAAVRISISAGGHRTLEDASQEMRKRWAPVPVAIPVAAPDKWAEPVAAPKSDKG